MILQGRLAIPVFCFFGVLFDAEPLFVHPGQIALGIPVPMLGTPGGPVKSLFKILFDANSLSIGKSHLAFGQGMTSFFSNFQIAVKPQPVLFLMPEFVQFDTPG